jgi:hypothetical protein
MAMPVADKAALWWERVDASGWVQNPADFFVYRAHNVATSVAKFSPNGYWVASGGKVTREPSQVTGGSFAD